MEKVYGFLENKSKQEVVSAEKYQEDNDKVKDFIIETGTKNGWLYRKWNSGYCELSYIKEHTFSIVNQYGNVYRSEKIQIPFPFTMTNRYSGSVSVSIPTGWANVASMTQNNMDVYAFAGGNSGKITNYINIHVIGTWK